MALAFTTFGVGYIPGAPGTYGSVVGVAIYLLVLWLETPARISGIGTGFSLEIVSATLFAFHAYINPVVLVAFILVGVWASGRSAPIFGRKDPSQAVVDEVMGQMITFCFVPFGINWMFIFAGFLLFRVFDIVKPFPARSVEMLQGGLGICADDVIAGVYAGICLGVAYAIYLVI